MIIHNEFDQGSGDWLQARLGIPTASKFGCIITPTGGKSTQAKGYMNLLLAEIMVGEPVESFQGNKWTERGQDVEQNAVGYYEFQRDVKTQEVGFVTDDARSMGCSPDRLVGDDGLLEIKCPGAQAQVANLLAGEFDPVYKPQVQGQMMITGRAWCDSESFHPRLPTLIVRQERDEEYIKTMDEMLAEFNHKLRQNIRTMIERGYLPPEPDAKGSPE